MSDDDRRRERADDEELADRFSIDDTAAQGAPEQPPGSPPPADLTKHDPSADRAPVESSANPDDAESRPTRSARHQNKRGAKGGRPKKPHRKAPWWELPALIALAIAIAIVVKTFLIQPFYIPSESMEKTLHGCPGCSGDRILVSKIVYDFRDPHPGDIVVFNAPTGWDEAESNSVPPSNPVVRVIRGFGQLIGFVPPDGLVLVKRVIAVGGQSVKGVVGKDGQPDKVYVSNRGVNGPWRLLDEPFVYETPNEPDPRANFGPITVPKGRLWVMGDHRDESADSRYHCGADGADGPDGAQCQTAFATVPNSKVIGKAVLIAWPPSRWTTLGTPSTFTSAGAALGAAGVVPLGVVVPVFVVARRRRRRR